MGLSLQALGSPQIFTDEIYISFNSPPGSKLENENLYLIFMFFGSPTLASLVYS